MPDLVPWTCGVCGRAIAVATDACVFCGAARGADRSWTFDESRRAVVQPAGRVLKGSAEWLRRMRERASPG
jgi:hypothetical protein